jgi:HNH endonuclease
MSNPIPLPPQKRLHELFDYDKITGIFTRKTSRGRGKAGKTAGNFDNDGYVLLVIDGKKYKAHRIAWMYVYGEDPGKFEIEHKSRNRADNSISNLRKATRSQNCANKKSKGYRKTINGKYEALIKIKGKQKYLGSFNCPLLARLAYENAAKIYFGEFAKC